MNNDKLDALIKRIASEHGFVLSQDDPVLMMHTLNEVLLEQNEKAHAELLNKYQAILENNFTQWQEFATKKTNTLINASINNNNLAKDHIFEKCTTLIDEKIKNGLNKEIYELARLSRQAAMLNLLASILLLASIVIVLFMLL
jgi:transcriptional activator TraM